MYEVRVERDSINSYNNRLVSFIISYPRIVLAESGTHRLNYDSWNDDVFLCERAALRDISKNSASSRAIPLSRMIQKVIDDPYMPEWTLAQKGMQGKECNDLDIIKKANEEWLSARDAAIESVKWLNDLGVHKQDANRLLESWAFITQIVTSSNWNNYFALRCDSQAHPALRKISRLMYLAYRKSTPIKLEYGQWHLPFVSLEEQMNFRLILDCSSLFTNKLELPDLIKFSAARCAWVSYENFDKVSTKEAMLSTFDKLMGGNPKHLSPLEHQASPFSTEMYNSQILMTKLSSNLTGYIQARKLIQEEHIKEYNPSEEEVKSWNLD